MRAVILAAAALLAGCASYDGLKAMAPDEVSYVQGAEYRALSECVVEELRTKYGGAWTIDRSIKPANQEAWISAGFKTILGTPAPGYSWGARLAADGGRVAVETRSVKDIWGRSHVPDDFPAIVSDCAGKPVAAGGNHT